MLFFKDISMKIKKIKTIKNLSEPKLICNI